jgi:hypothetical protein
MNTHIYTPEMLGNIYLTTIKEPNKPIIYDHIECDSLHITIDQFPEDKELTIKIKANNENTPEITFVIPYKGLKIYQTEET